MNNNVVRQQFCIFLMAVKINKDKKNSLELYVGMFKKEKIITQFFNFKLDLMGALHCLAYYFSFRYFIFIIYLLILYLLYTRNYIIWHYFL